MRPLQAFFTHFFQDDQIGRKFFLHESFAAVVKLFLIENALLAVCYIFSSLYRMFIYTQIRAHTSRICTVKHAQHCIAGITCTSPPSLACASSALLQQPGPASASDVELRRPGRAPHRSVLEHRIYIPRFCALKHGRSVVCALETDCRQRA